VDTGRCDLLLTNAIVLTMDQQFTVPSPGAVAVAGDSIAAVGRDALAFQAALAEARRPVETHIVPAMTHVWPVIAPALPESQAAMKAIANFVRA